MKTINNYLLALMSVFMLTWTACSDSVDYLPADELEGQGVYFAAASASLVVDQTTGTATVDVYRSNKVGSVDIPLNVTYEDGVNDAVSVPTTASFADGSTSTTISISYQDLVQDETYKLSISVADVTPYAQSAIAVSLMYSNEPVYTWEVVSKEAVYLDDLFSLIGLGGQKTEKIVVEKAKEVNWYRFRSPYDNAYFTKTWGGNAFGEDYEYNYIILDGETYKDAEDKPLYYIKPTSLGFKMIVNSDNSVNLESEIDEDIFGSVAGNLSTAAGPIPPTSTDYPLGTYDAKKKVFNLGALFQYIEGYGYQTFKAGKMMLYLDPKALIPDYDNDFTWYDLLGDGGAFTSDYFGGSWDQAIQIADEDETFFRLPNLYNIGTNFFFYLDKTGAVSVLKGQKSGIKSFDADVLIEGTPGKSSYDPETNTITFGLTFYLNDKNGKKAVELMKTVETFEMGTEYAALLKGKKADDYVGQWAVDFEHRSGSTGSLPVEVTKLKDGNLSVSGLSATGLEDDVMLYYDSYTGLLVFEPQYAPDALMEAVQADVLVVPFDSGTFSFTQNELLVGGLTEDGTLTFVNHNANTGSYDSMLYLMATAQGAGFLTGYWNYLNWAPVPAGTKSAPVQVPFKLDDNQGELNNEIVPRRTYYPELNIQGTPVQYGNATGTSMEVVVPLKKSELF